MTNPVRSGGLIVLILLAGSCGSVSRVSADEGDDDYGLATGLYEDKRWALAEEAFQKMLKDYPGHPRTAASRLYLGLSQVQLKKYGRALVTLREFARKHPESRDLPHAEYRIAECSYHLGNLPEAVEGFSAFTTRHRKDPLNEWAWAYMGEAQRRLRKYDAAVVSLRKSLELFPRGRMADEAGFGLAQSTEQLGKTEEAITLYRTAAQNAESKRADAAQLQIGNLLFSGGKFEDAVREYELVPKRFPKSSLVPTSRLNAGFSYYQAGNYEQSEASFEQAERGFQGRQDSRSQFITAGYWKGLSLKARKKFSEAVAVLSEVAQDAGSEPLVESVLYQLADCTFRTGDLATARQRFLVVTSRWPQGQYGDHSLYFATECALDLATSQSGDARQRLISEAGLLLDKFERDYQNSRIHFSHDMQRGHFLILRDRPGDLEAAEELYNRIISRTTKAQTRGEARFELARLLKNKGDTKAALAMITPLARDVMTGSTSEFPESLILYAHLALSEGQLSAVRDASESYLTANQAGANRDQAWAHLALAAAGAQDWEESERAIAKLIADHPQSRVVAHTVHSVAEQAYDSKDWDQAIHFFQILAMGGEESQFFPLAQSGLGWSFFQKQEFETARTHFRVVVEKTPKHESAPEAGFKIGECLLETGEQVKAARAFQDALAKFQPSRRAFLAGIQAARVYVELNDVKAATAAYSAVDQAFLEIQEHDLILNEWALLLYEEESYEESDRIFARLVKEHPESDYADNARFSLAESLLVAGEPDKASLEFAALAADDQADQDVQTDSLYRLVGIAVAAEHWKEAAGRSSELNSRFQDHRYRLEILFQLGNAQVNLNQFAAAEKSLAEVVEQRDDPRAAQSDWLPHAWILLAESQVRQKTDSRLATAALATVRQFHTEMPDSKVAYRIDEVAGRAHMRLAEFDAARSAFQRVVQSKHGARTATAAKAQFMIAESYTTQKQHKAARDAYGRVYFLYRFPEWQEPARYQMAVCDQALGDKANAIQTFEKFLKEYPESQYRTAAEKRLLSLRSDSQ